MSRDSCLLNKWIKWKYIFPQRSPEKILKNHHCTNNSQLFSGQCGTLMFIIFVVRYLYRKSSFCEVFLALRRMLRIIKPFDERICIAHACKFATVWLFHLRCVHLSRFDPMTRETKRSGSNVTAIVPAKLFRFPDKLQMGHRSLSLL